MPPRSSAPYSIRWIFVCLACAVLSGCGREPERIFSVRGVVRAPHADGAITIEHEAIPDFMPAMTMPFFAEAAEVQDIVVGDVVEFEFRVGRSSRATKFRKVGRIGPGYDNRPLPASSPALRRLRTGDAMPDFSLIDQENRMLTKADMEGRHTVVTFIFTRCPVPEFCPLIASKFQALQQQLAATAAADVRLLSISIDPEHDRPAILRQYGEALGADFGRWRFATGTSEQIDLLARQFAVRTERSGATIDHTLATALIDPDGRVREIWRGNAWKPEEIVASISTAP